MGSGLVVNVRVQDLKSVASRLEHHESSRLKVHTAIPLHSYCTKFRLSSVRLQGISFKNLETILINEGFLILKKGSDTTTPEGNFSMKGAARPLLNPKPQTLNPKP